MILDKTCIVLLACNDYESTQLTVANLLKYTPENIPIYFLPNNITDNFDSDRVREIGLFYSNLYPNRVIYVNWVTPSFPYQALGDLIYSEQLGKYDYICKIDDDVFPITSDWIEELAKCFEKHESDKLGYVTGLINNNPWGFAELVSLMNLQDEYKMLVPKVTIAGKNMKGYMKQEQVIYPEIGRGGFGTVWQYPHLARWIHEKTTFRPEEFISATRGLESKEIDNHLRYSIGCMLFRKSSWAKVYNGSKTDEKMWHTYSKDNNMHNYAALNVPMVHLFFYNQRLSNKSILDRAYETFRNFANDQLVLLWDNSASCKTNFIEERLRQQEYRIKSSQKKLVTTIRKFKNYVRYRYFRKW
ncbi:glycosyltransferase family A protein [Draconibacterium orientale]|uniref:glycosyltransferase family A protein n=1 Tax=Draconibacterium orientale TaxID=1168034 RepID=UPI002A0A6367|nr:glycosyltransferase family A protein [Draconibacterium orientale]